MNAVQTRETVEDIMSTDLVTVTPQDNVYECAVKMKENDIGFIPVVDENNKVLGVVTDRDLVIRGYAEKHSGSTSVTEVMTRDVTSVERTAPVSEASRLMASRKIRRLPVTENGRLVGVVALADMAVRQSTEMEAGEALMEISENTDKGYADGKIDYAKIQ